MGETLFSTQNEAESRLKPSRSRSFSFGTTRKNACETRNHLLKVASSYQRSRPSEGFKNAVKGRGSIFHLEFNFMKRKESNKSTLKYREMQHSFLQSRNACRYICNVFRFIGMALSFLAFGLHLQYQWQMGHYSIEIIILSTIAATSFTFVIVLYSFFGLRAFSRSIVHFWISLAYGIIFLQQTHLKLLNKTIMACVILSTAIRSFCSLVERLFKLPIHKSQFLSQSEVCDLIGFCLACGFLPMQKFSDMCIDVMALGFLVMNTRMKSPFTIPLLGLYGVISGISIIGNLGVPLNKYIIICFVVRMIWDPLLDIYFSHLPPLQRWTCFFSLSRVTIFIFMLFLFVLDVVFFVVGVQAITLHAEYEWPIVIPLVAISGIGWFAMHATYFAVHISFLSKVARCKRISKDEAASFKVFLHIMSREGLRSFCGICHGVASGSVLMSGIFGAICWRRNNGTYPAFFLFLLTVEFLSLALFTHFATNLRGTAYGFGIVGPTASTESKLGLALPSNTLDFQTSAHSRIQNAIKNFFKDQFIESFGCEEWVSGNKITLALIEKKLQTLFAKQTPNDNHPYDNYVIFFSGMADIDGSWILSDNEKLSCERILNIWKDRTPPRTQSRLLIVSDAPNSSRWLKVIGNVKGSSIALQTCTYACDNKSNASKISLDVEESMANRGDFTLLWTSFMKSLQTPNRMGEEHAESLTKDFPNDIRRQGMTAQFSFSNTFLSESLSPARGDFYKHTCTHCCLPVVVATTFLSSNIFAIVTCNAFLRLCHRITLKCFKRKLWNIGEDIVLINS